MSFLKAALDLAALGFHVFPLQVGGKLPRIFDFPKQATRDVDQIKKWWLDPVMGLEQPYNVGISTTKFKDAESLVVVDVDNKKGKNGSEVLLGLDIEGFELPNTFSQMTPTGGEHLVFSHPVALKQGVNVLGKGLDIRSKGGYIVGAGSEIEGEPYSMTNGAEPFPCPKWVSDICGRAPEKQIKSKIEYVEDAGDIKRAEHYIKKEAPVSIEGEGGDHTAFIVAAKLKDMGLSEDTALDLMLWQWNDRCEPEWDAIDLKIKVENAYRYGEKPVGADSPILEFEALDADGENCSFLETMNKTYALVYVEGSHFVIHETKDEKSREKRVFLTENSFRRKFSPHTVAQEKGKAKTYAEIWLDWKKRREYQGICFAPERESKNNYYNLWRGFTTKPKAYEDAGESAKAGFNAFYEHARDNVCGGDAPLFNWLMGYFAHMVQKPYERPLTTLVFRGQKGTGKNALIDRIGRLIGGGHYLVAHDSRYLTSNFNGHLDACLCLVLDEAFWSGDKSAEGKLKGITTSPEIMIERKGKEPYIVDNLVRLVVIGNEDWLVPASADERRYAVFDVGNGRQKDRTFFNNMRNSMDNLGGDAILLDYLQKFDLKSVDINDAPETQGLYEQKMSSLSLFGEFWLECLSEGKIIGCEFVDDWLDRIPKNVLKNAFYRYLHDRNVRNRSPGARSLWREIRTYVPNADNHVKTKIGDKSEHAYDVGTLNDCRIAWSERMNHEGDWD